MSEEFGPFSPILPVPVAESPADETRRYGYVIGCPAWLHNGEPPPDDWDWERWHADIARLRQAR